MSGQRLSPHSSQATSSKDFLQRIVPEVESGNVRNIVDLARKLRMPIETTRYKVKGMLRQGLSIQACIDYDKAGLSRYYAYLTLGEKARRSNEKKLIVSLSEHAYLTGAAKIIPSGEMWCEFAVPRPSVISPNYSPLRRLLRILQEEKLLDSSKVHPITTEKAHSIRPGFYDLKHSSWRVDWRHLGEYNLDDEDEQISRRASPQSTVEFDDLDLKIARRLEEDALIRLSDIAGALKTTLNNVFYHYHKHILASKLLEGFVLRWDGVSPSHKRKKSESQSLIIQLAFEGLSINEEETAKRAVAAVPFLWSEASSIDSGSYFAQARVPISEFMSFMSYLGSSLGPIGSNLRVLTFDSQSLVMHPMPAHLFKGSSWKFDEEAVAQQIMKNRR